MKEFNNKIITLLLVAFFTPCMLFSQTTQAQTTSSNTAVRPGGADVAFRNGDYAKAIEICRAELRLDNRNFNSWFFLTRSLLQSGQYALTRTECSRALAYFPTNAALHEIMGAAAYYQGAYADALEALSFGIANGPDSTFRRTITWYQVGMIYLQQEQYHQAVSAFNEAVRLNPTNMDWLERSAFANQKAGLQDVALKQYQTIINNARSSEAVKTKAKEAVKELEKLSHLKDGNVSIKLSRAVS